MSRELKTLLKISQIVLGENNIALRDDIYRNLIMAVLGQINHEITLKEIHDNICKDLGLQSIPDRLIKNPLNEMVEEKEVIKIKIDEVEKYYLGNDLVKKVSKLKRNFLEKRKRALKTLEAYYQKKSHKKVSRKTKKKIPTEFDRLLGLLFYKNGVDCANSIMGHSGAIPETWLSSIEGKTENMDNIEQFSVDSKILTNLTPLQRDLIGCIREKSEELASYLFSLAQSYYLIQALHVDPECQQFCHKALQNKKIYLDTNCLLYLFIDDPEKSEAVREVVGLSKNLGITMHYTQETKNEYLQLIKHWKSQYTSFAPMPYSRFKKVQKIVKVKLLGDFTRKYAKNPKLTWEGYFSRLEMFDKLIEHYATLDNTSHPMLYDTPIFEKLLYSINDITPKKSIPVQRHDAYHILSIEKMRNDTKADYLGPCCWFLTFDTSLDPVEKEAFSDKTRIPSSILVDRWLAIISPLIAPRIPGRKHEATFSKLFASSLPVFGSIVEENDIVMSHGDWMDTDDLKIDDIARIYGDKRTRAILQKAREEPENLQELQELLTKELKIVAETILDEKIRTQKDQIEKLQIKVITLEKEEKTKSHQITSVIEAMDGDALSYAKRKVKVVKLSIIVSIVVFLISIPTLCILILPTRTSLSFSIGLILDFFFLVLGGLIDFFSNLGIINANEWWKNKEKKWYNEKKQGYLSKYKLNNK